MITIEEKLNIFSKLVFEKEQNKADSKLKEMYKKNDEIIKGHREKLEEEAQETVKERVKEAKIKKNEIISRANLEMKTKLLNKKRELLDDMVEQIEYRAKKFVDGEDYGRYLRYNFSEAFSKLDKEGEVTIYLTEQDIDKFSEKIYKIIIQKGFPKEKVTLTSTKENIIGGAIIVSHKKGVRIDATVKGLIEENREFIGQKVYEVLGEVGDINE